MQFKKRGKKIQVLAYEGYDKEKKRAIVKSKGTIDAHTLEPTERLLNNLTVEQKEELQSYIDSERQKSEDSKLEREIIDISKNLTKSAKALEKNLYELSDKKARKIYEAMDLLKKAMRKKGFTQKALKQKSI